MGVASVADAPIAGAFVIKSPPEPFPPEYEFPPVDTPCQLSADPLSPFIIVAPCPPEPVSLPFPLFPYIPLVILDPL